MQHLLVIAIALSLVGACKKDRPTREEAQAACAHQIELGYWSGFDEAVRSQKLDPKDPAVKARGDAGLVEQRTTPDWTAAVGTCTDGFAKMATKTQISCVMAAKTVDTATACLSH